MNKSAESVPESFLGYEVCWDFGTHDARAVQIPRSALKELLTSISIPIGNVTSMNLGAYVEDLDVETCIKHGAKIGWSTKCGGERITDDITPDLLDGGRSPFVLGVFRPTTNGEDNAKRVLSARIRVVGERAVACPPAGMADYPDKPSKKYAEKIAAHANEAAETVFNTELSKILTSIGRDRGWIPRRKNGGGVYFLPKDRAPAIIAVLDGLEKLCSVFYNNTTELFAKPMATKTWARRTSHHFEEAVEKMRKRLTKLETEGGNDSTADRASAETVLLKKDLVAYKVLLGKKGEELDGLLDTLKTAFGEVNPSDVRKRAKEAFDAKTAETPDDLMDVPDDEPEESAEKAEPETAPVVSLKDRAAAAFA